MKKTFSLLLSITALCFGLFALTSCESNTTPHAHTVTFVEEKTATCASEGNIAYYRCDCGKAFEDEEATLEITSTSTAINPNNHEELVFKPEKGATCVSLASVEHYACQGCEKLYANEQATTELSSSDIYFGELGYHVSVEFVPASAPKCNGEFGYFEHFKCLDCFRLAFDAEFSKETTEYDVIDSFSPVTHTTAIRQEEVRATCNSFGVKQHFTCSGCNQMFLDETLTMQTYPGSSELWLDYDYSNHLSLNFFQGVAATCNQSGVKDYYECNSCYKKYEDEGATKEIFDDADLVIPNTSHNVTYHPEQYPNCKNDFTGNMPYYFCNDCHQNYETPESFYPLGDVSYHGDPYDFTSHTLTFVNANKPTCVNDGNMAYYYCDCGAYFDEFNYYYSEPSIFFMGYEKNEYSHSLIYLPGRNADCKVGNIECYHCEFCDNYYDLEVDIFMPTPEHIISKSNAVIPATGRHTLTAYDYVAPTCTESGRSAYWKCKTCSVCFRDEAGLNVFDESLIALAPSGHSLTHYNEKPSTCLVNGNIAYSHCNKCNKDFNLLTSPIEDVTGRTSLPLASHNTTFVEGTAPTCTETGVKDGNLCLVCNKYFDSDLVTEIKNMVIPATGHSFETKWTYSETEHWHNSTCGHEVKSNLLAHNTDGYRIVTQPSCTAEGLAEIYCTVCLRVSSTSIVEQNPHSYLYVATVEPNCLNVGVNEHYACQGCDNWFDLDKNAKPKSQFEIAVDPTKHDYETTETVNGTCQSQGYEKKVCSICNSEDIKYNSYGYHSYKFTSVDDYYHQSKCLYCDAINGDLQAHDINNSNHCGICGEEFDFAVYLNYTVGRIDNSAKQYAFIKGTTSQTFLSTELKIPSRIGTYEVYSIEDYAFDNLLITSVYIPESVRQIGTNAFKNCTKLEEVVFTGNSKLTTIGGGAFENCTSLSKITLPQTVTYLKNYAFKNSAITQAEFYSLSDSYLGESIFEGCASLERVHFYDSCTLTTIMPNTFKNCTALKSVILPSSLKTIGNYAFRGCSALEGIDLPETLESIESYAFMYAFDSKLNISVTIPETVTVVGYYAFGYSNLSELYLLGFTDYNTYISSPETYGDCAFYTCAYLDRVVIGEKVEVISKAMFNSATSLCEIEFRNSKNIVFMGERAFEGTSLPSLNFTVSKDIKFIGYRPYYKTSTSSSDMPSCPITFAFENFNGLMLYDTATKTVVSEITSGALLTDALTALNANKTYAIVSSAYLNA